MRQSACRSLRFGPASCVSDAYGEVPPVAPVPVQGFDADSAGQQVGPELLELGRLRSRSCLDACRGAHAKEIELQGLLHEGL
jgi:hypothetical protein